MFFSLTNASPTFRAGGLPLKCFKISCLKALDLWNFCGIFSFPQTFKCAKGVELGLFDAFQHLFQLFIACIREILMQETFLTFIYTGTVFFQQNGDVLCGQA